MSKVPLLQRELGDMMEFKRYNLQCMAKVDVLLAVNASALIELFRIQSECLIFWFPNGHHRIWVPDTQKQNISVTGTIGQEQLV